MIDHAVGVDDETGVYGGDGAGDFGGAPRGVEGLRIGPNFLQAVE